MSVRLVSLRRKTGQVVEPSDELVLMEGDALVLAGKAEVLEQVELRLLKGPF
jgi:uncharacterized protein with PhoU and TrkA domain